MRFKTNRTRQDPARSTAATDPVQALLDNPIIQTLLAKLRDGAEVEVQTGQERGRK